MYLLDLDMAMLAGVFVPLFSVLMSDHPVGLSKEELEAGVSQKYAISDNYPHHLEACKYDVGWTGSKTGNMYR